MKPTYWIIVGLAAIIVLLVLFDRDPPAVDLTPYKTEIAILKADRQEEQARFKEIIQNSNVRAVKDSIALNAKDKRIAALEKRASQERTPEVDTIIRNSPALESFVNTQSEIIQEQKEAIDTLKASVEFHKQVNRDLITSHEAEARISKRIEGEQDVVITKLEKALKKKTKGVKAWKVATVISLVGGFFLGAQ